MMINMVELDTIIILLVNANVLDLAYVIYNKSITKDIFVVFDNGSNYDYYFIINTYHKRLKENVIAWENILKNTRLFQFQ